MDRPARRARNAMSYKYALRCGGIGGHDPHQGAPRPIRRSDASRGLTSVHDLNVVPWRSIGTNPSAAPGASLPVPGEHSSPA